MSKITDFLTDAKVFFFATVDENKPKVRPFGLFFEHEEKLYFGVGDYKPSYQQLNKNPNFELSALRNEDEWIRLSGKAVFDDDEKAINAAFEKLPHLRDVYDKEDGPKLAVFYADEIEAVISDLSGKSEKVWL